MVAVSRLSATDFTKPFMFRSLLARESRSIANVPTLPASVGVKNPCSKPSMTSRKMTSGHITPERERMRSPQLNRSPFGAMIGLILQRARTRTIKRRQMTTPGMMPATKSLPIDCCVMIP